MIYEPSDDSFLLAEQVKKHAKGDVLDIGTGSGIQAEEAAKKANVRSVLAVDIQEDVIEYCKNKIKNKKIRFIQSNLFSNIETESFDTIIFNPPYLPEDPKLKDLTLDGGKQGYEIIEGFLKPAKDHLNKDGIILLLFSSLTGKDKVDDLIKKNDFSARLLNTKHILFEDLYVYLIENER